MKGSVAVKIGAAFGIAIIALLIIGGAAYYSTAKFVEAAKLRSHSFRVMQSMESFLMDLRDAESAERGYVLTGDESYSQESEMAARMAEQTFKDIRDLTRDNSGQQRRLDELDPLVFGADGRLAALANIRDIRAKQGADAAVAEIKKAAALKRMENIRAVAAEMESDETDLLQKRDDEVKRTSSATQMTIIFGTALCAALLCAAAMAIVRGIANPLRELSGVAAHISEGDLGAEVTSSGARTDEVGTLVRTFATMTRSLQDMAAVAERIAAGDFTAKVHPKSPRDVLGTAFATMTASLSSVVKELLGAVNVLTSAGSEILAATSQLASGAAQTAAAVSETTTTVEEVKQTVQSSNEKGRRVAETARKVAEVAQTGRTSVEQTVATMARIRRQMETIASSIVRLSEQSQAIGEIIAVVDDLAAQTNLLAVNASIEAAKAGEHGEGFAVVAQEVKSLAEQSKQATAQVRAILSEIQKATSGAVMATEQGAKSVEVGVEQSNAAGSAIAALSETISDAAEASSQITAAGQEQYVGMDQVARAMESIKAASEQAVASTRQAEEAAKGLHDLGLKLREIVERFTV